MFSDMMEEAYFRLRECDNLLRDLDIADVKELKRILTTNAVWQENQALKVRWEKLKEYLTQETEVDYECCHFVQDILEKMQELEE